MTTKQRMSILLDRWPRACRAQGWNPQDRDLRLRIISQAIGRQVGSMNDLDNATDVDAVYATLGRLADNVARTVETLPVPTVTRVVGPKRSRVPTQDSAGLRRRLLWLIEKFGKPLGGRPYVLALMRDKWHITPGLSTIEDLDSEQLHQLMISLRSRARSHGTVFVPTREPEPSFAGSNNPF
jgi:hypothetical protein